MKNNRFFNPTQRSPLRGGTAKSLAMAFFLFASCALNAQMNYWAVPPNAVNFTSSPTSAQPLPGAPSGGYVVSNGMWDSGGNLLFYIVGDIVHDGSGNWAGQLPTGQGIYSYSYIENEIAIVPVPGRCHRYYVVYLMYTALIGNGLVYTEIDASGGNVTLNNPANPLIDEYSNNAGGIAVSKAVPGSLDGSRRLYVVVRDGIHLYNIGAGGITPNAVNPIYTNASLGWDMDAREADLNDAGTRLTWAALGSTGKFYSIALGSGGGTSGSLVTYTLPASARDVKGVEFSTSGTYVYCSAGSGETGGIYRFLSTGSNPSAVSNSSAYYMTHLERGRDGYIYALNASGQFGRILSNSLTLNAYTMNITVQSNGGQGPGGGVFTLPDQVDGENYGNFNGIPLVTVASMTANGANMTTNCSSPLSVYNCNPISFNATFSGGTPSQYRIDIQAVNTTCAIVTGTGFINYSSGWLPGTPPANLDLRTLTDAAGLNLGNSTGKVKVTLNVQNECRSESSAFRYLLVNGPPTPASVSLTINSYMYPGVPQPPAASAPGVPVGIYSASFNINNSTGYITYYTIEIDQVNCANGAFVRDIYPATTTSAPGSISSLTAINVNQLNVPAIPALGWPGGTGFFANHAMDNCYRVYVTVGNDCSSSTANSYLKFDCTCLTGPSGEDRGADGGGSDIVETAGFAFYPNPATSSMVFRYGLQEAGLSRLALFDPSGRLASSALLDGREGDNVSTVDLGGLAEGIYYFRLVTPEGEHVGKFLKSSR